MTEREIFACLEYPKPTPNWKLSIILRFPRSNNHYRRYFLVITEAFLIETINDKAALKADMKNVL